MLFPFSQLKVSNLGLAPILTDVNIGVQSKSHLSDDLVEAVRDEVDLVSVGEELVAWKKRVKEVNE